MDTANPDAPNPDVPNPEDATRPDLLTPAEKAAIDTADKTDADAAAKKPARKAASKAGGNARRARKSQAEDPVAHVVMKTSRMLGKDGRSVARNRVARTTERRAVDLVEKGFARIAHSSEVEAADAAGKVAELA